MHKCILCKSENIKPVFDLGEICPSTFLKLEETTPPTTSLALAECPICHLVQLDEIFELDNFYRQYWYKSSLNPSMINSLKDVVNKVELHANLQNNDLVIDIGCNDGTLFTLYSNKTLYKVGFDPAINLRDIAEKRCNVFINDYFNGCKNAKAKVITAIAMFYDVLDPHEFLENITASLDDEGIFVIQMTDLLSMLRINAFDNICHEHMCVYSLNVLNQLLKSHNLEIFDLEYNDVNGGSLRVYSAFNTRKKVSNNVINALNDEASYLKSFQWDQWKLTIDHIKTKVVNYIKESNKKVYILGASTKGNTLLQYFGINNEHIPYAADVNADKFGLKTVATNIPIISEEEAMSHSPDVFLVLPWHFRKQIIAKNQAYLDAGGLFLFPLPTPQIVSKIGIEDL